MRAERVRSVAGSFAVRALGLYALCRVVTGILVAVVATRQVPTGWTGPSVDYLSFTAQWDAQWYLQIAAHGYPRVLPLTELGDVSQNPWAFYPLFPFSVRGLMDLTGAPFHVVASTLALVLGAGAAVLMGLLLRERLGATVALVVVGLYASQPAAAVLQVGYAESLAMLLLVGYLVAISRERWLVATGLAVAVGLTRPIALPLGVVTLVAVAIRWRARHTRPVVRGEAIAMVVALAGCGAAGLVWPALAWAVTGSRNAYTDTMAAWRGSGEVRPVIPWLDMSRYLVGDPQGPILVAALAIGLVAMVAGPWAAALGPQLRTWSLAYPAYLLAVLDPYTSVFRYLIPLFPLHAVAIGAGWSVRRPRPTRVAVRAAVLLVAYVVGQWFWLDILWRFIPPSDYPP